MRFNVLYITVFFIPRVNETMLSTLLRPFGQHLYGFRGARPVIRSGSSIVILIYYFSIV